MVMESTEGTKISPTRAAPAPEAISLLDFREGPAPELGLYAVAHVEAGCVSIEAIDEERSVEAIAARSSGAIRPLPERLSLLRRFAAGEPVDVARVPVVIAGPPFFVEVWTALRRVRRAEVSTYAQLARLVRSPRAMRAVGQAMARNPLPLVVPCHRVIADRARLGGYTGGVRRKRALLSLEGIELERDLVRPGQLAFLDRLGPAR
jgi:methylated-DNA-[protein]-cysteine S-methyltransferase